MMKSTIKFLGLSARGISKKITQKFCGNCKYLISINMYVFSN